jgi:hypothetical protein
VRRGERRERPDFMSRVMLAEVNSEGAREVSDRVKKLRSVRGSSKKSDKGDRGIKRQSGARVAASRAGEEAIKMASWMEMM